ncbi:MAG: hypothetical protein HKN07_06740 [Acidimicrobiia bacterium]|nr:hypothetical protein [Acidimicrobiia bacterium]
MLLVLVLAVASFSAAGLLMALLGVFRAGPVIILGSASTYTAYSLWGPARQTTVRRAQLRWIVPVSLAVLAFNIVFASGVVVADRPASATAITANRLADGGSLEAVAKVGPFSAAPVVRNDAPGFASEGSMEGPRMAAAFFGVPAFVGSGALRVTSPLLAGLAMLVLYAAGLVWLRPFTSLLMTLGLATNLIFIIGARSVGPVIPALVLAVAGLWALGLGRIEQRPGQGAVAGFLLGTSAAMSLPGLLSFAGLMALIVVDDIGGWNQGWVVKQRGRQWGWAIMGGASVPGLLAVWDAIDGGWLREMFIRLAIPVLVVLTVFIAARLLWERRISFDRVRSYIPWWLPVGVLMVIGVYVVAVRSPSAVGGVLAIDAATLAQALSGAEVLEEASPWWLLWYAGAMTVVVGLTGWVLLAWGDMRYRVREWRPVYVLAGLALTALIWDPQMPPTLIGAAEAFVPLVVPALLLGLGWVVDRLWDDPDASISQLASITVAVLAIAFPLLQTVPLWNIEPQDGADASVSTLCREIDRRSAVIVVDDGESFGPTMAATVHASCGVPAVFVGEGTLTSQLTPLIEPWRDEGRLVVLLANSADPLGDGRADLAPVGSLAFRTLASTVDRPPDRFESTEWMLYLGRFG